MIKKTAFAILMALIISNQTTTAQNTFSSAENNRIVLNNNDLHDAEHPCISAQEYETIEKEITKNKKALGLDKVLYQAEAVTSLDWPLRNSANNNDCSYYYVSAFVDLNTTTGAINDWNCGSRTYDGHRGIDIAAWPFGWDKMDNNAIEVIAAAAGTIVAKVDGNPDRVCNGLGGGSNSNNYMTIQHADGSQALYVHLKTGAMTTKIVGQTVAKGEFLGIPGSAGQSTGVHLHFEIRSLGTFASYIDPNFGTCNAGIGSSWWAAQKPYVESQIVKLSTHSDWPAFASCPNTYDTPNIVDSYVSNPGANGIFHVYTKHVTSGMIWNFRILNPNNSVFDSWNYTSLSTRTTSAIGWNRTLPNLPGVYTFEGTFNGITCTKTFSILSTVPVELVSFTSECDGKNRTLNWTTASESNNDYFTIENSKDGKDWTVLDKVNGLGNSSTKHNYAWIDTNSQDDEAYFRLKQTDFNGESKYSSIISSKPCGDFSKRNLVLYPNPASNFVTLRTDNWQLEGLEIKIYNILGTLVKVVKLNDNMKEMNVSDLSKGTYVVSIKSPSFTGIQKLIIK